jgi:pyruvate dehydrogenase E1 component beta subunit
MREISYGAALNEALFEEMERDDAVIQLGEDISPGGVFGITTGLVEKFGEERIIDMPIAETAIIGAAIGAALAGLRPIAEIMFIDFIFVCMDGICNWAAKQRFTSGGTAGVPIAIRAPYGAVGLGPHHGQCLEACFQNIPGLKLVMPSTPYDAKGLLKSSIRNNDPILFLENKDSYKDMGEVPVEEYTIPLGKADCKRKGTDVSIIAIGSMVKRALEAAEELAAEGIECEVIDPRCILPLDRQGIIESVTKTHRAVIVHEAPKIGGVGGEIAAVIAENCFEALRAPIIRVGAPFTPLPRPPFEKMYVPDKKKIVDAVKKILW